MGSVDFACSSDFEGKNHNKNKLYVVRGRAECLVHIGDATESGLSVQPVLTVLSTNSASWKSSCSYCITTSPHGE